MSTYHLKTTAVVALPSKRAGQVLQVVFHYTSEDPLAVTAQIDDATWVIGRDLLYDGLSLTGTSPAPYQRSDVASWVSPSGKYFLHISSPFGNAAFYLPLADVSQFLHGTFQLVPRGREYTEKSIDKALAGLFGQEI